MKQTTLNMANIQSINDCIRRMLDYEREWKGKFTDNTEFTNNEEVIKRTFAPCPCPTCPHEFSQMDIYHRLILIDSLYSTNVNQMRTFGLEEMTDAIWNLCSNGNGNHSDAFLAQSLHYLITLQQQNVTPLIKAFNDEYGYYEKIITNNNVKQIILAKAKAISLLSKYFYFVALMQKADDYGFPIYDSIVCGLIRPVEKYIGLLPLSINLDNMQNFILAVKRIVDALESADPNLWNPQNSGKLKFELLDYFLWHIGKAGEKTYNSLLSKTEYLSFYPNKINLPHRIVEWENMYNKIKL
ncbi:MAG: hypothetical protein IKT96_06595 [Paludibacteraceae bacterium]|nr:hypothetical protein [Paludibacteraceae bacterium]